MFPAVFCADRAYLPHLATAIASIKRNSADSVSQIYVVSTELTQGDIHTALGTQDSGLPVILVDADASLTAGFFVSHHITESTYLRFFLAELLPATVSQVLYLDCDTLVLGSLKGLQPIVHQMSASLLHKQPLLAAAWRESASPHLKKHGFTSEDYFNAGVLLLNIDAMRFEGTAQQLAQLSARLHEELRWWDQDALNLVFQHRWIPISSDYNFVGSEKSSNPKIAHFSGTNKPWMWGCTHPLKSEYRKYRRHTSFYPFRKSNFLPAVAKKLRFKKYKVVRRKIKRVLRVIKLKIRP